MSLIRIWVGLGLVIIVRKFLGRNFKRNDTVESRLLLLPSTDNGLKKGKKETFIKKDEERDSKLKASMACLVSMTLSVPLSASHWFTMEIAPRKSVFVGLSSQPTSGTAAKPSASCRTNTGISSLNRSCQDHLLTPSKPHFERMYCCLNVDSCSYMIISGYWVGPDIDDGWGYVEAFVNPIT